MSTELATVDAELPMLFELAKQLVPTGFLPDHIKTPGQAVAIILAGRELGMPPMRALRSLKMVRGNIVESADSQLERFKAEGGIARFVALSDETAELYLKHPNNDEHTEVFTIADAKRAGLIKPDSGWTKYPKAMLRSRAITAGLKSVGWGVGLYGPDEVREIAPVREVKMPTRLSARAAAASPAPEGEAQTTAAEPPSSPEPVVELDERPFTREEIDAITDAAYVPAGGSEPDLAPQLEASLAPIDESQRRALFAAMREGKHTKEQVSTYLKRRGIASSKDVPVAMFKALRERLANPAPLSEDASE